jgi:hypothetical protein
MTEYSQITDLRLQARIRDRYQHEIAKLENLGFRHLAYCLETLGPYSAILQFPIIPYALLKREILQLVRPLRIAIANIILFQTNPPAFALCMGMGIKFYSAFSDGTLLISSDFISRVAPRSEPPIIRLCSKTTPGMAWSKHKNEALRITEKIPVSEKLSFNDYVTLSEYEEGIMPY